MDIQLTWTRKKEWGSEGMTYRAETLIGDNLVKFAVDSPKKGEWVTRAWIGDGGASYYRRSTTLAAAKGVAIDIVAEQYTMWREDFRNTVKRAEAIVQAARERVQFRKDTCGCKTPLHTMRCGVGGVVAVVVTPCRECGRKSTHKLDCYTGRTAVSR